MKRFLTLLILIASATAQSSAPAPAAPPADENSQKARALIAKAIEALGGQAYLTVQNKGESGRAYSFYHGQSRDAGTQYLQYHQYPDKDRFELLQRGGYLVPLPLVGVIVVTHKVKNKNDLVLIHDGNKGYEISYKGTAPEDPKLTTAFLRRRQHSLDMVLRKWINEPGTAFYYEGAALAAEKPAEQVTITNSKNDSVTLFLDHTSYLPVKLSYSWRDPEDNFRNVEEEIYDGYKLDEGIMTPHSVTRFYNGDMAAQRFLNSVKYNQPFPDDFFAASVSYDPYKAPQKH
jgi:hypothetical protein